MSHWERRQLMLVADTIRRWLAQQKPLPAQQADLYQLLQRADQGSKTILTDAGLLSDIKSGLCHICAREENRLCAGEDNALYCKLAQGEPRPMALCGTSKAPADA